MERRWKFDSTKLRTPREYATPQTEGIAEKYLISTGASLLGSHAINTLLRCPRQFILGPGDGLADLVARGLLPRREVQGPVTDVIPDTQVAVLTRGRSVYMTRGTLVHVGAAHAAARQGALQHGGAILMGHHIEGQKAVDALYTTEEAIEVAAAKIGTGAFTIALPVARRVGPAVAQWLREVGATGWRIVAVETQVAYWTAGVALPHTARIDLLLEHQVSGLIRIWDYKTANKPADAVEEYRYGLQTRGLERIGRVRFGPKFDGVWLLTAKDPGREGEITLEEHRVAPVPHIDARFDQVLALSRQILESNLGKPTIQWPVMPTHCHGCPALADCVGMG